MERGPDDDPTMDPLDQIMRTLRCTPYNLVPPGDAHPDLLQPPTSTEVTVPENIYELLDTCLEPAGLPGANTEKFTVRGYPDLLVRLNIGALYSERCRAKAALGDIKGVHILPHEPVYHLGEAYVITKRVKGRTLEEALTQNPDESLLSAVDTNWKNLTDALTKAKLEYKEWVEDIDSYHQYMIGTLAGDTRPRLWMVDIPDGTISLHDRSQYDSFECEILHMANAVVEIEQLVHRKLAATRWALFAALEHFEDMDWCGNGVEQAVLHVLHTPGAYISPIDQHELLNRMRTR